MKTKDKIINTAMELFAHQGVNDTSMTEIATRTGISKAVIYHHFDSKQSLLHNVTGAAIGTANYEITKAMELALCSNSCNKPGRELLLYVHIVSNIDRKPLNKAYRFILGNSFYIPELRDYITTGYLNRHREFVKSILDLMIIRGHCLSFNTTTASRILSNQLVAATVKYISLYPLVDQSLYLEMMRDIRYTIRRITQTG